MNRRIIKTSIQWFAITLCIFLHQQAAAEDTTIIRARDWLLRQQDFDAGSWGEDPIRETATAVEALLLFSDADAAVQDGRHFLERTAPDTVDFMSRKLAVLAETGHVPEDDIRQLISMQNPDGGFGFKRGYPSSIIDSIHAAEALQKAGIADHAVIGKLLYYITSQQGIDGGFSWCKENESSLIVTADAVRVLSSFQPRYDLTLVCEKACSFICNYQDSNGGFGEGDSSAGETAACIEALSATGSAAEALLRARRFICRMQDENGSWGDDVTATARAIKALITIAEIQRPNLTIDSTSCEITPSAPVTGTRSCLRCTVQNTGATDAANVKIRLSLAFSDSSNQSLSDAFLPVIPAYGTATVELCWTANAANGQHLLSVTVDPDNEISETNEADNSKLVSLSVRSLPDVVIDRYTVSSDAQLPRAGAPFTVTTMIRNTGESEALLLKAICTVTGDGEAFRSGLKVGEVVFSEISGGGQAQAHFTMSLPSGDYTLSVHLDPDDTIQESNEHNNRAETTLRVLSDVFQGVDLAVVPSDIIIVPEPGREGMPLTISVTVRNSGDRDALSVPVVLRCEDETGGNSDLALHTFAVIRANESAMARVTASLPAGNYRIIAVVDPAASINEVCRINNAATKAFTILPPHDVVDLDIDSEAITFNPDPAVVGEHVAIRCDIRNVGTVPLYGIPVRIYDGIPEAGGKILDNRYPELILPVIPSASTGTITLYMDTEKKVGPHIITVIVDPDNRIHENREDNNRATRTLTVTGQEGVDYEIRASDLMSSPPQPVSGDTVIVQGRVWNNGQHDTGRVTVVCMREYQVIGQQTIDSMQAGTAHDVMFTWNSEGYAGVIPITMSVDPWNEIDETNEYNNNASVTVMVRSADLMIRSEDIEISPLLPVPDTDINIRCRIANIGNHSAPPYRVVLYRGNPDASGERVAVNDMTELAAGDAVSTEFIWHTPSTPGSYRFFVVIDPDNKVIEENEHNNSAMRTVTIADPADVAIDTASLVILPEAPTLADEIRIAAAIENRGGTVADTVRVALYDGEPSDSTRIGQEHIIRNVQPGGQVTFERNVYLNEGQHRLCMTAALDPPQTELRYDNNNACREIFVGSVCDIEVRAQDITINPPAPVLNENVTIGALIRNKSNQHIESVSVKFFDGEPGNPRQQIGQDIVITLDPGETVRVENSWLPPCAGMHEIWVVADPENMIPEENEHNNKASRQIVIAGAAPDLAILSGSLFVAPPNPHAGEITQIVAHVNNFGGSEAAPATVRFYAEGNGTRRLLGETGKDCIKASETAQLTMTWIPHEGEQFIAAIVDPDNLVQESHEGNNRQDMSITVTPSVMFYDDCGNPEQEQHLVRGQDGILTKIQQTLPQALATVSRDPEVIIYRYEGLQPGTAYDLILGYIQEEGAGCMQQLIADGMLLHEPLLLPEGVLRYITCYIPATLTADGTLELRFEKTAGTEALVSEIYLIKRTGKKEVAIQNGTAWLTRPERQAADGGGFVPFSVSQSDALALQALVAVGASESAEAVFLKSRIAAIQASNGSWDNSLRPTSLCISALAATADPSLKSALEKGVAFLLRTQRDGGDWNNDVTGTGMAIIALLDAGLEPTHDALRRARQWLISNQNFDGFWGETPGAPSDMYRGYHPVVALIRTGSALDQPAKKAIAYFKSHCSTQVCRFVYGYLHILIQQGQTTGSEVTTWKNALLGYQRADGGWKGGAAYLDISAVEYTAEALCVLSKLEGPQTPITKGIAWIANVHAQWRDIIDTWPTIEETALAAGALYAVDRNQYQIMLTQLLSEIVKRQNSSGTWGNGYALADNGRNVEGTGFFLWTLSSLDIDVPGKAGACAKAQQALLSLQNNNDKGWCSSGGSSSPSSVRATSLALLGLLRSGVPPQDSRIAQAVSWLMTKRGTDKLWDTIENSSRCLLVLKMMGSYAQELTESARALVASRNSDGGWGKPDSTTTDTAWAVMGLNQLEASRQEVGHGVIWLVAAQNSDGGWAALPGIPASATRYTGAVVWALAGVTGSPLTELELVLNKRVYYPNDIVRITVQQVKSDEALSEVTGTVTESGGRLSAVSFAKKGAVFTGEYHIRHDHPPGTDSLSVIATGEQGTGFAVIPIRIDNAEDAQPDLMVCGEDITWQDTVSATGISGDLKVVVHNIGLRDAQDVLMQCYDGHPQAGGRLVHQEIIEHISGNGIHESNVHLQLPFGAHELYVSIDPDNTIPEQNERNNSAYRTITVLDTRQQADLVVMPSEFEAIPDAPFAGNMVVLRVTVHNRGEEAAQSVAVQFQDGSERIGDAITIPYLAPNQAQTVVALWDTLQHSGRHYVHAVVDPNNTIAEFNELNNDAMRVIDVGAAQLPDLTIDYAHIVAHPETPHEGALLQITAPVCNRGVVTQGVTVALYDGDPMQGRCLDTVFIYEALRSGEMINVRFDIDTAGMTGEHRLYMVVDPENLIEEGDEENNSAHTDVMIASCGIGVQIATDKPYYIAGESYGINVRVINMTDEEHNGVLALRIRDVDDNTMVAELYQGRVALASGDNHTLTHTGTTPAYPPGRYRFEAIFDEDSLCRTRSATDITIAADMRLTASIRATPPLTWPHQQIQCQAKLYNPSINTVLRGIHACLRIHDDNGTTVIAEQKAITHMLPREEVDLVFYWNTKDARPGQYTASLVVAAEGGVTASDNASITVTTGPLGVPLFQGAVKLEKNTLYRSDVLNARCFVKNCSTVRLDRIKVHLNIISVQNQKVMATEEMLCRLGGEETGEVCFIVPMAGLPVGETMAVMVVEVDNIMQTLAAVPFSIANRCPIIKLVPEITASRNQPVVIDAGDTHDPDNESLTYIWELVQKPEDSASTLQPREGSYCSLTPDRQGQYRVLLTVTDGLCWSGPEGIIVNVENRLPIAQIQVSDTAHCGNIVKLDGSKSFDPDSDALHSFFWTILERPLGSSAEIENRDNVIASLIPDMPGMYRIQLSVSDGFAESLPVTALIEVNNTPPVAYAGEDTSTYLGDPIMLDGSTSFDPDNDHLRFAWEIRTKPTASIALINNADSATATFSPDLPGQYEFVLTVSDSCGEIAYDDITIQVNAAASGICEDIPFPIPPCDMYDEYPYDHCSGKTIMIKSYADYKKYAASAYGYDGKGYAGLAIAKDITAQNEDLVFHSPCTISVKKNVCLAAPNGKVCLDGKKGVRSEGNLRLNGRYVVLMSAKGPVTIDHGAVLHGTHIYVEAGRQTVVEQGALIKGLESVVIASCGEKDGDGVNIMNGSLISSASLFIRSGGWIQVHNLAGMDISGPVRMISTGTHVNDAVRIHAAALRAQSLCMSGLHEVSIDGPSLVLIDGQLIIASTGTDKHSRAWIKTGSVVYGSSIWLEGYRAILGPWSFVSTPGLFFMQADGKDGCDVHGYYRAGSAAGNCLE
ncbi:MAG: hypothetical protein N3B18_08855 [Desulfobacterota bacterium]|nr:hypothetical protein [Thermodesulfobacteriota bacterium]